MGKITLPTEESRREAAKTALKAAQSLRSLLEARAESGEKACALDEEVLAAIHRHRFFALQTPQSLNGIGLHTLETMAIMEALSYADASTGWTVANMSYATAMGAAWLGDAAISQLFEKGNGTIICGHGMPVGKAIAVQGGFMLSGKWSYGTGVKHATHIHSGAIIYEGEAPRRLPEGGVEVRTFITPRDQVVFADNWDVLGLRATGSIDYSIDNQFVPEAYSNIADTRDAARDDVFRLGNAGLAMAVTAAVALGVGRRVLDEVTAFAKARSGRAGMPAERTSFQEDYARHEAALRSVRAFIIESWEDVERTLYSGDATSTRQETLIHLATIHAAQVASEATIFAYKSAGGTGLRRGILQRFFRDMHAVTQHWAVSAKHFEECGKELAGLVHSTRWGPGIELVRE